MRTLKIVLLATMVVSFGAIVSCSKDNDNNSGSGSSTDSVLYSNWIPLNLVLQNTATTPASDSVYEQTINASALTTSVLSKGLVMVYANESGSGGKFINYVSDFGIYPTFASQVIYLDAYGSAGAQLSLNQIVDSVRYVIIPGKVATTSVSGQLQTFTPTQLQQMDYSTLTKVLNIPAHGSSLK